MDKDVAEEIAGMRGQALVAALRPACAYFRGVGSCSFGCWEEPICFTEEPEGGWPQRAYELCIERAEWLRAVAAEERGSHGKVKQLRDLAREAHREAVEVLRVIGGRR